MAMQVLVWRITASNNKAGCISGNDILSCFMGNTSPEAAGTGISPFTYPKVRMTWTGNKVDLVELVYAWEKAGCFNYGHVTIKEIVIYIESVFNINLGDYYHTFMEMRNRADRTSFLNRLIKFLNDRMDEIDRKK
jgi:hypothetical protein